MIRFFLCFVLASAQGACAPVKSLGVISGELNESHAQAESTLPILPVDFEYAIVPVEIGENRDLRFLFDTGATPTTLFVSNRTRHLNLPTQGHANVEGLGGNGGPVAEISTAAELTLGNRILKNVRIAKIDWKDVPFFPNEESVFIDGIIGFDLVKEHVVEVDRRSGVFRLHSADKVFEDQYPAAIRIPISSNNGDLYINVLVTTAKGGVAVPVELILDTGARGAISLVENSHPLFVAGPNSGAGRYKGIAGRGVSKRDVLYKVSIGGFELENVPVSYTAAPEFSNRYRGLIGAALLNRFRFVIDYPNQELILFPNSASSRPFGATVPSTLGLMSVGEKYEYLAVIHVHDGSEAERWGLQEGDLLVSLGEWRSSELAGKNLDFLWQPNVGDAHTNVCRLSADKTYCGEVDLSVRQ